MRDWHISRCASNSVGSCLCQNLSWGTHAVFVWDLSDLPFRSSELWILFLFWRDVQIRTHKHVHSIWEKKTQFLSVPSLKSYTKKLFKDCWRAVKIFLAILWGGVGLLMQAVWSALLWQSLRQCWFLTAQAKPMTRVYSWQSTFNRMTSVQEQFLLQ